MDISKNIKISRIGRTGRCGNTGRSTSFYDEIDDAPLAHQLVKTLADAQQEVTYIQYKLYTVIQGLEFRYQIGFNKLQIRILEIRIRTDDSAAVE